MDIIASLRADPEVLKEPRGFMRIVQLVLSIFAFATVTSVQTASKIFVECASPNNSNAKVVEIEYGYPFRIKAHTEISVPFCASASKQEMVSGVFDGNFSSAAEFFCFIGVMTFLFCLILIPLYVFMGSQFSKGSLGAKIDLIVSAVWALLWFIASTAWADNLSKMASYMEPSNLIEDLLEEGYCKPSFPGACAPGSLGDHSTLIVSVLFGYLNMGIQIACLWFLFKETEWHRGKDEQSEDFDQAYADPGYQTPEYTTNPSIPTTPDGNQPPFNHQQSFGSQGQPDYYGTQQTDY